MSRDRMGLSMETPDDETSDSVVAGDQGFRNRLRATIRDGWARLPRRGRLYAALCAALVIMLAISGVAFMVTSFHPVSEPSPTAQILAAHGFNAESGETSSDLQPSSTAVIDFGLFGPRSSSQQCDGGQPLPPVAVGLSNMQSTVPVDWWVDIHDTLPDGKLLWAGGLPPYGTLTAGQSTTLQLVPDPALCVELATKSAPVTFHATVGYGGIGSEVVTDTITPPAPGSVTTQGPGPHGH